MHRPRLLILDEPTNGLDPLNQEEFHGLIAAVRAEGRTVFLSSHILWEVEHTCDRVGIIRDGRLVSVDRVAHMKQIRQHVVEISFSGHAAQEWFADLPGVLSVTSAHDGTGLELVVDGELHDVLQVAAGHDAVTLSTREPDLEEIFLRLYDPTRAAPPTPTPIS
jgi:ABC-2 type transport system ATP-binding protein